MKRSNKQKKNKKQFLETFTQSQMYSQWERGLEESENNITEYENLIQKAEAFYEQQKIEAESGGHRFKSMFNSLRDVVKPKDDKHQSAPPKGASVDEQGIIDFLQKKETHPAGISTKHTKSEMSRSSESLPEESKINVRRQTVRVAMQSHITRRYTTRQDLSPALPLAVEPAATTELSKDQYVKNLEQSASNGLISATALERLKARMAALPENTKIVTTKLSGIKDKMKDFGAALKRNFEEESPTESVSGPMLVSTSNKNVMALTNKNVKLETGSQPLLPPSQFTKSLPKPPTKAIPPQPSKIYPPDNQSSNYDELPNANHDSHTTYNRPHTSHSLDSSNLVISPNSDPSPPRHPQNRSQKNISENTQAPHLHPAPNRGKPKQNSFQNDPRQNQNVSPLKIPPPRRAFKQSAASLTGSPLSDHLCITNTRRMLPPLPKMDNNCEPFNTSSGQTVSQASASAPTSTTSNFQTTPTKQPTSLPKRPVYQQIDKRKTLTLQNANVDISRLRQHFLQLDEANSNQGKPSYLNRSQKTTPTQKASFTTEDIPAPKNGWPFSKQKAKQPKNETSFNSRVFVRNSLDTSVSSNKDWDEPQRSVASLRNQFTQEIRQKNL